jgi:CheY-like chemotaxis protein
MPGMDGFQFYQRIKDIQYDVKACFMTAAIDSSKEFITKRLSGDNRRVCVARKPIAVKELLLLLGDTNEKMDAYKKSSDRRQATKS